MLNNLPKVIQQEAGRQESEFPNMAALPGARPALWMGERGTEEAGLTATCWSGALGLQSAYNSSSIAACGDPVHSRLCTRCADINSQQSSRPQQIG